MSAPTRRITSRLFAAGAGLCLAGSLLAGCADDANAPHATAVFSLDAPLCSSALPVELAIDSILVATDTFRVNFPPNHTSASFRISPGTHRLGASVIGGLVWPDTIVTLNAGETASMALPFYCS